MEYKCETLNLCRTLKKHVSARYYVQLIKVFKIQKSNFINKKIKSMKIKDSKK